MKISVITAVYNGGSVIADTLKSVAEQDHDCIEHIVIDGGSTDSTLSTIAAAGGRIAHLVSEPDTGLYDAFNKGLRLATGDVVAYLSCGDIYSSASVVSQMVNELSVSGVDAVFGDLSIVDATDTQRVVRRYSSRHFNPRRMAFGQMPAHPTLFLRREVYQSVGEYNAAYRIAGDFELCLRVFVLRTIRYRYVPRSLVRMRGGGLSNSGWRSKWQITREMRQACATNGVSTNLLKLCLRFPLKLMEML